MPDDLGRNDPYDFIKQMPLAELSRFVDDLCRKFGMTEAEIQRLGRMSLAELAEMLRKLEEGT
jgi:hypothetical protein